MTDPFTEKEKIVKAVAHLIVTLELLGYKPTITLTNKEGQITWTKRRKRNRVKKETSPD